MTPVRRAGRSALLPLTLLCLASAPARAAEGLPMFGLMADVGAPDGLALAGVVRPLDWLRLHAGLLTNTVGVGIRAGASWLPLRTAVAPSLNLDIGRYFNGDYRDLVDRLGGDLGTAGDLIGDVGYNFWSATAGLELGSSRSFSFFLRAGYARWYFNRVPVQEFLQTEANDPSLTARDASVRIGSPAVKLGVLLYLF